MAKRHPNTADALAIWRFNNASGNVPDETGNGNDAVENGTVPSQTGIFGTARGGFSQSNYFVAPSSVDLQPQTFTVAYWIYWASSSQNSFAKIGGHEEFGNGLWNATAQLNATQNFNADGKYLGTIIQKSAGVTGASLALATAPVSVGWHHVGITVDVTTGDCKAYFDGQLVDTDNMGVGETVYYDNSGFWFGKDGNAVPDQSFNGWLADVALYSEVKPDSWFADIYGDAGSFAVTANGTIVSQIDAVSLAITSLPNAPKSVSTVKAVGPDDIWVGHYSLSLGDKAELSHYDGVGWTLYEVSDSASNPSSIGLGWTIQDIHVISSSEVYAVGAHFNGAVHLMKWDGISWSTVTTSSTGKRRSLLDNLATENDMWSNGFLTSEEHSMGHWNGASIDESSPVQSPTFLAGRPISGLARRNNGEVLVALDDNPVRKRTGPSTWDDAFSASTTINNSFPGNTMWYDADTDEVWVSTFDGGNGLTKWDGTTKTQYIHGISGNGNLEGVKKRADSDNVQLWMSRGATNSILVGDPDLGNWVTISPGGNGTYMQLSVYQGTLDFPPMLGNQNPAPLSTGNSAETTIYFEVTDPTDNLDISTVDVYVNGVLAWTNDAPVQPGFTGNKVAVTNGYGYTLSSWAYLPEGTQTVRVVAEDAVANQLDETYTFEGLAQQPGECGRVQWGSFQWGATQWGEVLDCGSEAAEATEETEFPFSIYRFLMQSVRAMDQRSPGMLQPLLEEGLDPLWETMMYDRLTSMRDTIYDPATIADKWLPWLKAMVGFTQDLNFESTEDELRRIIANAIPYWNKKPTEQAIAFAIRLVVSENRFRVRNWFDFRFETDITHVTAQLQDFDPNAIDFGVDHIRGSYAATSALTGYPWDRVIEFDAQDTNLPAFQSPTQYEYLLLENFTSPYEALNSIYRIAECVVGERYVILTEDLPIKSAGNFGNWRLAGGLGDWTTEVRIVDEPGGIGNLNRDLIKFLMEQVRNHGERIDLVYVSFLDEFLIEENLNQWQVSSEIDVQVFAPGGELTIAAGASAVSSTGFEDTWYDQSISYRCQGASTAVMELVFWRVNSANFFHVEVDFDNSTLKLYRTVSSVPTQIGSTVTVPYVIAADQDVSIRVDALAELTGARLRVKLSGETLIDEYLAPPTTQHGGVGVNALNATCKLSLIEVMTVPATVERVGPNP